MFIGGIKFGDRIYIESLKVILYIQSYQPQQHTLVHDVDGKETFDPYLLTLLTSLASSLYYGIYLRGKYLGFENLFHIQYSGGLSRYNPKNRKVVDYLGNSERATNVNS